MNKKEKHTWLVFLIGLMVGAFIMLLFCIELGSNILIDLARNTNIQIDTLVINGKNQTELLMRYDYITQVIK